MHRNLLYAAYGFLLLSGILHFSIDVVSQYMRGKRTPGSEATLYYGLNTAYALGQLNGTDNDLFLSLSTKKADVTFDTPGLWRPFDKANPGKVRRVAPGHNLRVFGMSVVADNDDARLMNLINVGVQEILNSGAVDRIQKRYDTDFPDMYLKITKPYSE